MTSTCPGSVEKGTASAQIHPIGTGLRALITTSGEPGCKASPAGDRATAERTDDGTRWPVGICRSDIGRRLLD